MFFSLLSGLFGWMPFPLRGLVLAVFIFFAVYVAIAMIKTLFALMEFISNLLTGLFGKIASLFM